NLVPLLLRGNAYLIESYMRIQRTPRTSLLLVLP
ncbi:MAG: hypothetical protein ACI909_002732, partial [Planctomycetota bacterium]